MRTFSQIFNLILAFVVVVSSPALAPSNCAGQDKDKDDAVVRGKLEYDQTRAESWDGNKLVVAYPEIETKLRQRLELPGPPYPADAKNWDSAKFIEWEKQFVETAAGKEFLEDRKKRIDNAHSFDVKFEQDGTFVIYDVPVGVYGIQGRFDKEIGGTKYGFEVFGQIEILEGVDEMVLPPMRVEVTPLMQPKQAAPPIDIKTHDDKQTIKLESFGDDYLFVVFWTSLSPTAATEQKLVQEMFQTLKSKYDIRLLSINIDDDREKALKYIVDNKLKGSHGFTDGAEHRTIFDYGVRSFPSFWLIGKDDKILMTQYEIAQAMRVKPDLATIVEDRIEGKDAPTPAENPGEEKQKD